VGKSLEDLQRERGQLLERIAHQRSALASAWAPVQDAEQLGTRVLGLTRALLQRVRENPIPVAVAVAGLLVWRPKGVLRWARRGFWLWRRRDTWGPVLRAFIGSTPR
jgi:hypothetical protein